MDEEEEVNFLVATTPKKSPVKVQVKSNRKNTRILVPESNNKGYLKQTFKTPLKARVINDNLKFPNATTPSSVKKGGVRRTKRNRRR